MNMNAKFVVSIGLLSLMCFMLPGSLRADTLFIYTGNKYTGCFGTYASSGTTCAGPYAMSITLDVMAGTPLDNLTLYGPGSDITADVSAFSFTDGTGLNINKGNAGGVYSFQLGTDALGNITFWNVSAGSTCGGGGVPPIASSVSCAMSVRDSNVAQDLSDTLVGTSPVGYTGEGFNRFDRGTWAPGVSTVPEPFSYVLLGTGLLCLLVLAVRSRRYSPPFSRRSESVC